MKKVLSILLAVVILLSALTVAIPVTSSAKEITCPKCYGLKRVSCTICGGLGYQYMMTIKGYEWRLCVRCHGRGEDPCPECGGWGTIYVKDPISGSPAKTSITKLTAKELRFTVSWQTRDKNTTGYQVQYSTSSKYKNAKLATLKNKTDNSFTASKLEGGKKYYVRVRVYGKGENKNFYSAWSASKAVVVKKVAKPAATSISKIITRELGFSVSWAKRVKNLTGYQIQYATNNKFKSGKAKAVKGKTNTTITGLTGGKRYYVRVRTYRTYGGKNYFSAWSASKTVVVKKVAKPAATSITKLTAKTNGFSVAWKAQTKNVTGYQLQYAPNSNYSGGKTKAVKGSTSTTISGLKSGQKYYVRIRTYRTYSGKNYYSAWSASKSVVTKKNTAPSVPYITTFETGYYYKSNGAPAPTIYFQKISDCKGYQLQTSTYSDFRSGSTTELYTCPYNSCGSDWDMCYTYTGDYKWGWYLPSGSNEYSVETAEEDNPLKCDTTYYFRIRAYKTVDGTNYYSGWSQTVSSTW